MRVRPLTMPPIASVSGSSTAQQLSSAPTLRLITAIACW